jgi:hypothetical protein
MTMGISGGIPKQNEPNNIPAKISILYAFWKNCISFRFGPGADWSAAETSHQERIVRIGVFLKSCQPPL